MNHGHYSTHMNHHFTHLPPLHHPFNHYIPPTNLSIYHQPQHQPNYSDYERTLIDEVMYLHSLWHRGPPSSHTNPPYLKPTHTTHFKKKNQNKTLKNYNLSDKEWPVVENSPSQVGSGQSCWPSFRAQNKPVTRPATAQEQARVMGVRIQSKGVESCSRLFDDDDDDDEDEDDGDDEEEVDFFENLFEEDGELRGFYEKNCEGGGGGEFICLVCGVIRNNVGRKYKNCVALVQHSITVSKTKKKKAHRAYGNVVCKVLGWDVKRLPSLPNSIGVEEVIKGEVKNHADEDSVVGEIGRDAALAKPSQTERENIPDALEKDNITSTDDICTTIAITHGEGEVKKHNDENSTPVEMEGDAAHAIQSQSEPESTPDAIDKDNDASTDIGCMASAVTHTEPEAKFMSDECKVENHDSEKDRVCNYSKNVVSQRENNPELNQEEAVKVGEGCSVLGNKPSESESSLVGDDPYEQLSCLPGAFQIPDHSACYNQAIDPYSL